LWQMITGQKPYDVKTASIFELQTKIVNEKLQFTSTIFDSIIELSTEKDLGLRFKNCDEVIVKFAGLQKPTDENIKNNINQDFEKTHVDKTIDNIMVESPNKINSLAKPENIIPLFLIVVILTVAISLILK